MVKYRYLGYTYLSIPEGWVPRVKQMLEDIDKQVRPWYVPRFILNWIYWLAMGNSVVRARSRWWYYNVYDKLPIFRQAFIMDIKDKYAGLRVYGFFNPEVDRIVEQTMEDCENLCERCSSTYDVRILDIGWLYNFCLNCRLETTRERLDNFNYRYQERIPKGYSGAMIYNNSVLSYLHKEFLKFEEEYPDFKFYQLKLKFNTPRLYVDGVPEEAIFKMEEDIAKILKNEEEIEPTQYQKEFVEK